jgi:hypothetical protein
VLFHAWFSRISTKGNPPVPARKAMFVRSAMPGTVLPALTDNYGRLPFCCVLTGDDA